MSDVTLYHGDCLEVMRGMPDASVDAVVTDPPYPEIDREYGRWTEAEWFAMMRGVVPECMRLLKPSGSAVFVLQPNSERLGRMRLWLWEFMLWVGREWGIVQDVWWWNVAAMPQSHAIQGRLTRPSVKACVWIGPPDCWRDQDAVLWRECDDMKARRASDRSMGLARRVNPSGHGYSPSIYTSAAGRGGTTPFNVLPIPNNSTDSAGAHGHGAGTPLGLCCWWARYICPPGGIILDPFMGSGTCGLAALRELRRFVGVERHAPYFAVAKKRLDAELALKDGRVGMFADLPDEEAPADA